VTGHAVLTPFLQALAMLTSDFVTMARATNGARRSPAGAQSHARRKLAILSLCWFMPGLNPEEMQSLTFVMLGFAG
jgi:hypothetical protein